jgi:hypothetical protein
MSELDDFLTETLARQVEAEKALHNGDPTLLCWLHRISILKKEHLFRK